MTWTSRTPLLVLTVSALACALAPAQQDPKPDITIKSHSELVLVPVLVRDHGGAAVAGLQARDFLLQEDGQARNVIAVEEVHNTPEAASGAAPAAAAPATAGIRMRDTVILVLDLVNTPTADQERAKTQLVKYLETHGTPVPTTLLTVGRGGIHIRQRFTTDTAALQAALGRVEPEYHAEGGGVEGEFPLPHYKDTEAVVLADRTAYAVARQRGLNMCRAALEVIGAWAVRIPGRKTLLWGSGSFPFAATDGQLLNRANVVMYPIDLRGNVNHFFDAATDIRAIDPIGYESRRMHVDGYWDLAQNNYRTNLGDIEAMAAATGGQTCRSNNDPADCLAHALGDMQSYYLLSFRPEASTKPGWHKLKVEVRRAGVAVRARSGYFVETPRPAAASVPAAK